MPKVEVSQSLHTSDPRSLSALISGCASRDPDAAVALWAEACTRQSHALASVAAATVSHSAASTALLLDAWNRRDQAGLDAVGDTMGASFSMDALDELANRLQRANGRLVTARLSREMVVGAMLEALARGAGIAWVGSEPTRPRGGCVICLCILDVRDGEYTSARGNLVVAIERTTGDKLSPEMHWPGLGGSEGPRAWLDRLDAVALPFDRSAMHPALRDVYLQPIATSIRRCLAHPSGPSWLGLGECLDATATDAPESLPDLVAHVGAVLDASWDQDERRLLTRPSDRAHAERVSRLLAQTLDLRGGVDLARLDELADQGVLANVQRLLVGELDPRAADRVSGLVRHGALAGVRSLALLQNRDAELIGDLAREIGPQLHTLELAEAPRATSAVRAAQSLLVDGAVGLRELCIDTGAPWRAATAVADALERRAPHLHALDLLGIRFEPGDLERLLRCVGPACASLALIGVASPDDIAAAILASPARSALTRLGITLHRRDGDGGRGPVATCALPGLEELMLRGCGRGERPMLATLLAASLDACPRLVRVKEVDVPPEDLAVWLGNATWRGGVHELDLGDDPELVTRLFEGPAWPVLRTVSVAGRAIQALADVDPVALPVLERIVAEEATGSTLEPLVESPLLDPLRQLLLHSVADRVGVARVLRGFDRSGVLCPELPVVSSIGPWQKIDLGRMVERCGRTVAAAPARH